MLFDLKFAFRQLARTPGFTVIALLTLALGIGGTVAMFSLVETVLLRPLDYPEAERIVTLWSRDAKRGNRYQVSGPDYSDWRDQSQSFEAIAKYQSNRDGVVVGNQAETVGFAMVSGDFARVLGVAPEAGRWFDADELKSGGAVVVSEGFAQLHFASATGALGQDLKLLGHSLRIIGVMPATLTFPLEAEIWLPIDTLFPESYERSAHNYRAIARLRPTTTPLQAQTEIAAIAERLAQQYPATNTGKGTQIVPLQDLLVERHRATLWTLMGAVALVLLIACANVANLLLARATTRGHEIAVRAALGAGRVRIIRQLLAESLLLALAGGGLGVLAAAWLMNGLIALAPAGIPRLAEAHLNPATLLFAVGLALLVCVITGLLPAWQATRNDLTLALRSSGRGLTGTRGRARAALVSGQLALSLMLLAGASLLLKSFQRLAQIDPGYRTEKLLVVAGNYPAVGESDAPRAVAYFEEFRRQVAALPGVEAVTFTGSLPVDELQANGYYKIEGQADLPRAQSVKRSALWRATGPDYFSLLGIPLRAGREFDARDAAHAPPSVIINEAMARASWPGEDPIGHRIKIGWDSAAPAWMTIVGVVADTRQGRLEAPVGQELYVPAAQHPAVATSMKLVVRTGPQPLGLMESIRRIGRALNPDVPLEFTTADRLVANTLAAPRFRTRLIAAFSAIALILALVGVAGLMAVIVAERRAEIGLRLALGAEPADIVRHYLGRSLRLAAIGLALGLAGSFASARILAGVLYATSPTDPLMLGGASLLLLTAVSAATLWPARQAAKVDPLVALRAN